MKSVQEFTRGFRDDTQDPDHLQAGDALALLLSGEADADDTAKSITMIYDVSLKRNNGFTHNDEYNKVRYFWMRHMCGAIYTFGDDAIQERLIGLLSEISKQPEVKCPDGSTKMHCGVQIYWRDLPGRSFELQAIGLNYNSPLDYGPNGEDDFLAQAPGLLNSTKFAAKLLARGEFIIGLPLMAAIKLWQATEQTYDEYDWFENYERQVLVPVAATWLLIAGESIYSHCLNDGIEDINAEGWARCTWTRELWANWKKRFQCFAESDDLNDECRDFAARTVRKMAEIESVHQGR